MLNTKYDTAPVGKRKATTMPLDPVWWGNFSQYMQSFNDKPKTNDEKYHKRAA